MIDDLNFYYPAFTNRFLPKFINKNGRTLDAIRDNIISVRITPDAVTFKVDCDTKGEVIKDLIELYNFKKDYLLFVESVDGDYNPNFVIAFEQLNYNYNPLYDIKFDYSDTSILRFNCEFSYGSMKFLIGQLEDYKNIFKK